MIETTVSQRRGLESERILKENEDQRAEREVFRLHFAVRSQAHDTAGQCRSPSVHPI